MRERSPVTRRAFFVSAVFFSLALTHAAEARELIVSGNARTANSWVEHSVERCEKEAGSQAQTDKDKLAAELRQCLLNSQLFSEVQVEVDDEMMRVQVEERWTLIPVPYGQTDSSGNSMLGLVLIESNFLGRGQTVVLGAMTSSRGNGFFVAFQNKNLFFTPWSLNMAFSSMEYDVLTYGREATWEEDTPLAGYQAGHTFGSMGFGHEFASGHSAHVELVHNDVETSRLRSHGADPGDRRFSAAGLRWQSDESDYKLYFNEGWTANVIYFRQLERHDEYDDMPLAQRVMLKGTYGAAVFGNHAVLTSVYAGGQDGGDVGDLPRMGNRPGFRGIRPEAAWVNRYGVVTIDYLVPLRTFPQGTWTAGAFAEIGRMRAWQGKDGASMRGSNFDRHMKEIDYGSVGLGTYYFLKKVALPGVGFEIGHNPAFQNSFATLSIGMSFD